MAIRLVFNVPGSAGAAGREPSMDAPSWELVRDRGSAVFFFLWRARWMDGVSDGRFANW